MHFDAIDTHKPSPPTSLPAGAGSRYVPAMLQRAPIDRKLHVLVATPAGAAGKGGIDRIMGALGDEIGRQTWPGFHIRFAASRGGGHLLLSPFFLAVFLLRLVLMRFARRLDVVHINLASRASTYRKLMIAGLCRRLGTPYVLHLHGGDYETFWDSQPRWMARMIYKMFDRAARIVVLGRVWQAAIARRVPTAAGRIVIVPNASARPALPHRVGGGEVHVLFLGRLIAYKGLPQLLEALDRLRDLPGWRATLAGDGDVEGTAAVLAEKGLADRVALPGWVDTDTVAELIASADILVLPSLIENLPLSVIEGMAAGLAVVASRVGAVEDIVSNGETGLLVEPGDADGLTAALARLIGDPGLRQRLGQAARRFHESHLDLETYAYTFRDVWEEAARTPK
jgi:glycosyltransferase involved in cell wall biosynthesis